LIKALSQSWTNRELIQLLVLRDLKMRYKRSILGFLWTLINPLITIMIFSIVFSHIFSAFYNDYKLYMISGILFWNFFAMATGQGLTSITANGPIIRKTSAPRMVFPIATVLSNFINLILSLAAFGIFLPFTSAHISIHLLWVPVMMPLLLMFTLGVTLIIASANVFLRDTKNIWDLVLMLWFFLTPVFYPRSIIPNNYHFLMRLNPMLSIIEVCRIPISHGQMPPLSLFFKGILATLIALLIGINVFKRCEERFFLHV
jgi:ABC-type polysaccharide/polyol phosphate export permease